jgi:SAM-dependent methyltransferase
MTDRFSEIYDKNEWGYGSGVGSLPLNNVDYIKFIRMFIERNNIRSVVDFGCGDWQFSRFIGWVGVAYSGFDIVADVIAHNQKLFARDKITFSIFTPQTDLPSADLFICKDVFQHLPNGLVRRYLDLFKERAKFLLITNDDWPAEDQTNAEIAEGGWRPVRLDRPPFCEVAPVIMSWTIEWGGWKPTRKATCLIAGQRP